jgi:general secretion pathway protein F/MSHA biogenesis protein MshG
MKYFEVTALKKGKKEIILIDALDKEGAFAKVKDIHKAMPLKSKEVDAPLKERIRKSTDKFFAKMKANKKVDIDELIIVTRQMSVMLSAGISVNEVLEESKNFTKNKLLKVILEQSLDGINAGRSITESMSQYKGALGSLTISMVKFGEQTGSLDEALGMLSDTLENIRDNTDKFKKALRYPIVTIIAIAIAFTILILFVVPKFKSIFESLNADLPVPTLILLNLEWFLSNYGFYLLGGLFLVYFFISFSYRNNKHFKWSFDKYILKLYIFGNIIYMTSVNRFVLSFAKLIKAGIPITDALNSSTFIIDNSYIREKLESITSSIQKGVNLTEAFKDTELFESIVLQMVKTGESSGALDDMLIRVSDYYKMKFDNLVDNISSLIEPIMIVFIAGMVLLLALGIFLPMWDMAGAVKS